MSHTSQPVSHRRRLFLLAWVGVYPMVTLISLLFGDVLMTIPVLLRTLILSGLVVSYMVFVWIPIIEKYNKV